MSTFHKIFKPFLNSTIIVLLLIGIVLSAKAISACYFGITQLQKQNPSPDSIKVFVPNKDKDSFYVTLKTTVTIQPSIYTASKIIAISDIEGNFDGLYSFLVSNKVMDKKYNWIFGNGDVVFLGDFVDRGAQAPEVLWLIYKLEDEAAKQGGKVHYILGNHEAVNIQGIGFSEKRYTATDDYIAEVPFDKSKKMLFSAKLELGKWLRTKNSIERIGDYIFVHGGISPKLLSFKPDLDTINNTIRKNIEHDLYHKPGKNSFANLLIGREGPLWFRGMATDYKYYSKLTELDFKKIQTYFGCRKIVIGHTPFTEIQTDFNGLLIMIDTPHSKEKFSGRTMGLLIENNVEFKVDDQGKKNRLQ